MDAKLKAVDNSRRALELRRAGLTYREIGERLDISHTTAKAWVDEWLEEYKLQNEEQAQAIRSESLSRLDAALTAIWPQVRAGSEGAISTMLKIEAQRAKLLGLEAPARVEADVKSEIVVNFTMG
jgi:hypothetical protein